MLPVNGDLSTAVLNAQQDQLSLESRPANQIPALHAVHSECSAKQIQAHHSPSTEPQTQLVDTWRIG